MESEHNADLTVAAPSEATPSDRRAQPRFTADGAATLLIDSDRSMQCRLTDLSLEGCRLRTVQQFSAQLGQRVEVAFRVNGLAFKFAGITQWTNRWNLVGIRFIEVPRRSRADLAELIGELKEEGVELAGSALVEPADAILPPSQEIPQTPEAPAENQKSPEPENQSSSKIHTVLFQAQPTNRPSPSQSPDDEPRPERRTQPRYSVDLAAVIQLIDGNSALGARLRGRIQDLSSTGCRIRTDDRFTEGIETCVEIEFRAQGLPFRLSGIIQAIHGRSAVGIRFLEVSARKRQQLEQLMQEIARHKTSAL